MLRSMAHDDLVLEVRRSAFGDAELHPLAVDALAVGQIRMRIDSFAITANNISYAGAGDLLGYWNFFPADDPTTWGRVPAMGWAEIVESANPDLPVGGRYYGWFPMASSAVFTATATSDGFRDDGAHRSAHAPIYRAYVRTDRDPFYEGSADGEDRHAVLRVLFLTGFLADEFFADNGGADGPTYFGAEQVIVLSASSKTAIGFAQRAAQRDGLHVVGLTSTRNVDFVRSLGYYDSVVTYDDVSPIEQLDSVVIDMAGDADVIASVHAHLGDRVAHSMMVGRSHHHAQQQGNRELTGPAPQFFFAPTDVQRRVGIWGGEEYQRRATLAMTEFIDGSRKWMRVERRSGAEGVVSAWVDVHAGSVAPDVGIVASYTE